MFKIGDHVIVNFPMNHNHGREGVIESVSGFDGSVAVRFEDQARAYLTPGQVVLLSTLVDTIADDGSPESLEFEILREALKGVAVKKALKKKLKKMSPTSSDVHVPSMMKRINKDQGLISGQQEKAAAAELVTFPDDVEGSKCANCKYVNGQFCEHPKMGIPLLDGAEKMCCDYWDHEGTKHFTDQGQVISKDKLDTNARQHIATRNFALTEERKYPIHDISHARNALARVAQHGTAEEKAKVKTAVYRKYPSLKPVAKSEGARRVATIAVKHGDKMLMGKRRDNGKWTTPGGHLNPEENFLEGALRELLEETGIEASTQTLKSLDDVYELEDKTGKALHVQPFQLQMSEKPSTSITDDPDGEVHRWQWVNVKNGLPEEIKMNLHTPFEKNILFKVLGIEKIKKQHDDEWTAPTVSDIDESDDIYPPINNLEAEVLKDEDEEDSNNLDQLYGYQLIVEGMDWELSHSTIDPQQAKEAAMEQLEEDPMHYRKLDMENASTDDSLAKDWTPKGLSVDLGSGQTREPGHIGIDSYPYDHGTFVHDLNLGLPFPDESCENVRLCNVEMEDPKPLLSEIHRVMMPGGQFVYEGPNDIYNYPEWESDYPGLVLTNHESSVDKSDDDDSGVYRQTFTRVAVPDAATANDAEPRIGVAAYDMLPADALLAYDALSYEYSDATSSGRGNRQHGYPSQGALFEKDADSRMKRRIERQNARKNPDPPEETVEEKQVHDALNQRNPNPNPPKRLARKSKETRLEKVLKQERFVPILKANAAKQIVYGVVLSPNEIDAQDDFMTAEDIEKTAHGYLKNSRVVGSGHEKPIQAHPVESFIAPQDFDVHGQYGNQEVKKGSWVLGIKVEDPNEWDKVARGEYTGFSVGGHGARAEV